MVRKYSLSTLFLCETKTIKERRASIGSSLRFDKSCFIKTIGGGGGLALFWMNDLGWEVILKSERIVDCYKVNVRVYLEFVVLLCPVDRVTKSPFWGNLESVVLSES